MLMGRLDMKTVRLLPKQLLMKEQVDMTLFLISEWSLVFKNASSLEDGIMMKIVLKRKITNEIMTTFLPSILLILITFATTFFKPIYFEAALSVNLTTMLVLTTIFIGVMEELPTTAYIKMIDVWLVFCQLIPFTEVILLTVKEYKRKEAATGEEESGTNRLFNQNEAPRVVELELHEEDNINTKTSQDKTNHKITMEKTVEAWKVKEDNIQWVEIIGEKHILCIEIIIKLFF